VTTIGGAALTMDIYVVTATSEGVTELAAFDACLLQAGVGNLNLLYLSSVIPPQAQVLRKPAPKDMGLWGDRLYCVMAQKRTSIIGHEVWAGIGWVQELSTGRGLFAEAMGSSKPEVELQLERTLHEMTERRADGKWEDPEFAVAGIACSGPPVCALAVAAYVTEGWS
jgi:arginine decarboxylase